MKEGYIGRISNTGSQYVKAPITQKKPGGKTIKTEGDKGGK